MYENKKELLLIGQINLSYNKTHIFMIYNKVHIHYPLSLETPIEGRKVNTTVLWVHPRLYHPALLSHQIRKTLYYFIFAKNMITN